MDRIEEIVIIAAQISPFPKSTSSRHGVDCARQAAAGFGCAAALEAEKWVEAQK